MSCRVNGVRVFKHRFHNLPFAILEHAIEAAVTAGVAGDVADLLDLEDHHVGVAVDPHLVQGLHVPGLFTLAPQFATRT